MDRGEHPDFQRWIVTYGDPKPSTMLPKPRRAIVRTGLYDGTVATLEVAVVAQAKGHVCVEQVLPGREPWCAWIPAERGAAGLAKAGRRAAGGDSVASMEYTVIKIRRSARPGVQVHP